jgi:hypothetical protein
VFFRVCPDAGRFKDKPDKLLEGNGMANRMLCGGLCFFFLTVSFVFFSCGKKAAETGEISDSAQPGGTETGNAGETPGAEEAVPFVEGPYLNESTLVKEPVPGVFPFNPYKDVKQNNLDLDDVKTVVAIYLWELDFENSVIDFKNDGTYSLGHHMSDGYFAFGKYEVNGNSIIVHYPSSIKGYTVDAYGNAVDFYGPKVLEWLFDGENDRVLVYDKTYKDYSTVTCLRYGDRILQNAMLQSPYGEEYEYNGMKVIKCNRYESSIKITENLRMRKYPDINAETVTLPVYREYLDSEGRRIAWDFNTKTNVAEAGNVYAYDRKTVKQDTIDGITAPWYRIMVAISDSDGAFVWVFGGYVKELPPDESEKVD